MQETSHTNRAAEAAMPHGTPRWITEELVADTIETWQPYYADPLTMVDAVAILMAVGNLVDALESVS